MATWHQQRAGLGDVYTPHATDWKCITDKYGEPLGVVCFNTRAKANAYRKRVGAHCVMLAPANAVAYRCALPIRGADDYVITVKACNARDAKAEASRAFDHYANRGKLPGHRLQVTPSTRWTARRIGP